MLGCSGSSIQVRSGDTTATGRAGASSISTMACGGRRYGSWAPIGAAAAATTSRASGSLTRITKLPGSLRGQRDHEPDRHGLGCLWTDYARAVAADEPFDARQLGI